MALFDVIKPISQDYIKPDYFIGSKGDNLKLSLLGYKKDGSQNAFGKIFSFINPVYGILGNKAAQKITQGTDTEQNIQDDFDNRVAKAKIGLGVAQGVAGAITGNPALIKSGITDTIGGAGALSGSGSGPNYNDDFTVRYSGGSSNNLDYNDIYSNISGKRDYNNRNSDRGITMFKDGGLVISKSFYESPRELAIKANAPTDDPNFIPSVVAKQLWDASRSRVISPDIELKPSPVSSSGSGVISGVKTKDTRVNLSGLSQNLASYIDSLPDYLKSMAVITSAKDQPNVHVPGSDHGSGKGIDFRLDEELFRFMKADPKAKKMGIIPQFHAKGTAPHIHVKSLFKKGGSPLKKEITVDYATRILSGGKINGRPLTKKQIEYFNRYLPQKTKMEMGGELPFVPYAETDHTEDYFMIDKNLADKMGIFKLLSKMSFGEARYNERIFDQKSNLAMKMIMSSNINESKKKDALGDLVYDELRTHADIKLITPKKDKVLIGQLFKDGGTPKKAIKSWTNKDGDMITAFSDGTYLMNDTPINKIAYDYEFKELQRFLRTVNPGGRPSSFQAKENPKRIIKAGAKVKAPVTVTPSAVQTPITSTFTPPEIYIEPGLTAPQDSSLDNTTLQVKQLPIGGLKDAYKNYSINPIKPEYTPSPKISGDEPKLKMQNIFQGAKDILALGAGFIQANQKTPDFSPSQDFINRQEQIKNLAGQGFTPYEKAQFVKGQNDSYSIGVQGIVNASGGGANQGAILGSLNNLQQNRLNSNLQYQIADDAKRQQNLARYDQSLNQQLALDQNLYANKVNFINQNRNIGAQLIQATMQDIEQRKLNEQSLDLNKTISDFYKSQIERNKRITESISKNGYSAGSASLSLPND